MSKLCLGILFGGRSPEHDISIISAVHLINAIDKNKYDIVPIYIAHDGKWYSGESLSQISTFSPFKEKNTGISSVSLDLLSNGDLISIKKARSFCANHSNYHHTVKAHIDCMVVVMHGAHGEDGSLQGLLEIAGVPYTSAGVVSSAVGMDKIIMKQFFQGASLPVLPSTWLTRREFESQPDVTISKVENTLCYPVFVKPANLGSSIGVSKAETRDELLIALDLAFTLDRRVLIEKGLHAPVEINCAVLGYDGECVTSELELLSTDGKVLTTDGKYGPHAYRHQIPAPINDHLYRRIQEMSKDIFYMLDCKGVIRIDYMKEAETEDFYITEVNTIPGSMAFYLWEKQGLPYGKLIDKMVECALRSYSDEKCNNYVYESSFLMDAVLTSGKHNGSKIHVKGY
jgi:D-alanine-D-alanine ligase